MGQSIGLFLGSESVSIAVMFVSDIGDASNASDACVFSDANVASGNKQGR